MGCGLASVILTKKITVTDTDEPKQVQTQWDGDGTLLFKTPGNLALRTVPVSACILQVRKKIESEYIVGDVSTKTYIDDV